VPVTTTYTVAGMTCAHCVSAVTQELSDLVGVEAVDVDLATGSVTVVSAAELDAETVREAVDEAGYTLTGP
jgi:copper chaperone CopZ